MENQILMTDDIKNHYDENSEAVLMNINDRKFCFKHEFINASLYWESKHDEKNSYCSIHFESKARENFNPEWGTGYGGIRYCKKCKHIDCIHVFEDSKTYKVETDEFSGSDYVVDYCGICKRRILRSAGGYSNPSKEAFELAHQVLKEHNIEMYNCGSGYFIELPIHVSRVLRDYGEDAAKKYLENVVSHGSIPNFNSIIK